MNLGDKKPGKTPTKRPLYVYYIIAVSYTHLTLPTIA